MVAVLPAEAIRHHLVIPPYGPCCNSFLGQWLALEGATTMPQYFFNVVSAAETVRDEEGSDLPNLDTAHDEAIKDARSLMSDAILEGRDVSNRFIQISGEDGKVLLVVPFRMAIASCD
jgi:hypothetical protein